MVGKKKSTPHASRLAARLNYTDSDIEAAMKEHEE